MTNTTNKKSEQFKRWWYKNNYKVWRAILFPLYLIMSVSYKIEDQKEQNLEWSEERANKIFNHLITYGNILNEEDQTIHFFFDNFGRTLNLDTGCLNLKDRKFWEKYHGFGSKKLFRYMQNEFELNGFTKKNKYHENGWTEIVFTLIEK